ncbi:DUF1707 SHOCT-like domain-containing protein [Modestobacter marinus]|uniref:DUF1707 SHOCT-like domain-containing protein n=1 Tax=Modestobacter marinus TaxID=477641 RepID=UPI001C93BD5D|nr:DUF1707 domain-containing protein [Modestobacter marinus]
MATEPDAGTANATGPGTAAPRARSSDAERAACVEALQDAVARGLLTPDEGGGRMGAALAARFRDELPGLTADLPPAAALPRAAPPGWPQLGSMLAAQVRQAASAVRAGGLWSRQALVAALVAVLLIGFLVTLGLTLAGLGGPDAFDGFAGGGPGHHGGIGR